MIDSIERYLLLNYMKHVKKRSMNKIPDLNKQTLRSHGLNMQKVFISVNRLWFPFNAKYVFINQTTYPSLCHDSLLLPPLLLHMHDLCEAHNLISSNEHRYSLVFNNKESNTFNKKKREKKQNKLKKNALFLCVCVCDACANLFTILWFYIFRPNE